MTTPGPTFAPPWQGHQEDKGVGAAFAGAVLSQPIPVGALLQEHGSETGARQICSSAVPSKSQRLAHTPSTTHVEHTDVYLLRRSLQHHHSTLLRAQSPAAPYLTGPLIPAPSFCVQFMLYSSKMDVSCVRRSRGRGERMKKNT